MQRGEIAKSRKPGDASRLRVGIAAARFNEDITEAMLEGARRVLRAWKVKDANVRIARVHGSFELPLACARLIERHKPDAVVAIGCIVKGETRHNEYLARAVAHGLMRVQLDSGIPVGFGVITANDLAQARSRSRGAANKGSEAAAAALDAAIA